MKHSSLKSLIVSSIFCSTVSMNVFASDFQYEGLYYTIISESRNLCRLDKAPNGEIYSGDATVPENVINEGRTYTVESFENSVFESSNITNLKIEAKISIIPQSACAGCRELKTIVLPDGIEEIGQYAFWKCGELIDINIPSSLKSIGSMAFYNCESLNEISLSAGVTFLGTGTFSGCKSLTSFRFPENCIINNIWSMFKDCSSLKEVTGYENLDVNQSATFSGCISLKNIILPDISNEIASECYSGCIGLEAIDFTSLIKTIGSNAFEGCINLESLTFGEDFESLGEKAFGNCPYIHTVICKNRNPQPIDESAFTKTVYDNATLIVPWKCVDVYKNCAGWNLYKNIVETTDVIEPRTISFEENQLEIIEGSTLRIEANISPVDATHFHVEWSAPQEVSIAETAVDGNIASCEVTPTKGGTYILTVKCISDITDEVLCQNVCVLTVKRNIVPESMTVEFSVSTVPLFQPVYITVTVNPQDFTEDFYLSILTDSYKSEYITYDPHGETKVWFKYDTAGEHEIKIWLISPETNENILTETIHVQVVESGAIFDYGEGVIEVIAGTEGLTASIKANEGYILHSVTSDGIDVTSQFTDGEMVQITTLAESGLPNFKIVYEKKGMSANSGIENGNLKIVQYNNIIEVIGTKDENSPVTIYDDMGRIIMQTVDHSITLSARGIYILLVEGRSFKFKI